MAYKAFLLINKENTFFSLTNMLSFKLHLSNLAYYRRFPCGFTTISETLGRDNHAETQSGVFPCLSQIKKEKKKENKTKEEAIFNGNCGNMHC